MSFQQLLREVAHAAGTAVDKDPWEPKLRKLKGRVGSDGVERISTNDVFDALEVPMRQRASRTVRLSGVMRRLGWSNIRAHGLNPGSYRDRVRGYARAVPGHPATARRPNGFGCSRAAAAFFRRYEPTRAAVTVSILQQGTEPRT